MTEMNNKIKRDVMERFWEKVSVSDTGCWEWVGATAYKGYGQIYFGGRKVRAHRFSYERFVGAIPNGFELDHLCRNEGCVNPTHLEVVTHRENVLRGKSPEVARQMQLSKTHCPRGHLYNLKNTYIKLGDGGRQCRICSRMAQKKWREKNVKSH